MKVPIAVRCGDIAETPCDIAVLKHAQGFYGADAEVAQALGLSEREFSLPAGHHRFVSTNGRLPCKTVLFVGVRPPLDFGYAEIRELAESALTIIAQAQVPKSVIAMTMHGVGFGLDVKEAFTAQIAGILDNLYFTERDVTWQPQQLFLVEKDSSRAQRLATLLQGIVIATGLSELPGGREKREDRLPDAGRRSDAKKHVFVAMPYDESMEDVYEFGVREPVNGCGYLCERCDRDVFTGDILDRVRRRIADASLVIADMTGANPNVYLEVGYAWGKGVPTLLVAREGEELRFDVRTQKCIYYKNISSLRKQLAAILIKLTQEQDG